MRIVGDPDNDNERAVAGSAAESGSSLADGVLTLEAARQAALSGNPSVHEARARLQAARARVSEARARLFPKLTFAHKSTRTFQTPPSRPQLTSALQAFQQSPTTLNADVLRDIPAVFLPIFQPLFNTGSLQSNSNAFGNHSTGLTATWTVFDGFIREAQILASEHLKHAAGYALGNVRRLVVHAVDTAYYQVQLAVEQVRIATADEAFSREQLEETQKLRDAGRASQADVDNFRIRLLAAQANTTAAEGLFDTGRVVLAELMGLPDAALPGDLSLSPLTAETAEETTVPNAASWIEKAMRDRPDLRQLEQIVESEGQRVRAAKGLYSPAVGVSGTWGFDRDSTLHYSSSDQTSLAGVEVRWDLYTGGSRTARVRAAEATRAEAAAALARGRLAVQSEVRQAVIALHDAQEQIGLQREALTTARENRRLIQAAYVGGTQSLTRLNEAQRDYIQADVNLALARIRLRQAWSDLHAAAGGTTTVP
jgi:outer membrane protein TolC